MKNTKYLAILPKIKYHTITLNPNHVKSVLSRSVLVIVFDFLEKSNYKSYRKGWIYQFKIIMMF